jgi:hypothetical protein
MAANTSPIFEEVVSGDGVSFTSADTTTKKTICTAGLDGRRLDSIRICSDDTAAVNLAFYINDTSTDFYIGNVNVPIGSGYTTIPLVEALSTLSPNLAYLPLKASHVLKANCVATMTAAKTLTIFAHGGDF